MWLHLPVLSICIAWIIPAAFAQCLTDNDVARLTNKAARSNLYLSEQAFTLSLLKAINSTDSEKNIFFSPYSTFQALLLAYFGARGQTEEQLKTALNLGWTDTKMDILQAYRYERNIRLKEEEDSAAAFKSADKIYLSKEAGLRECMKDLFNDEYEILDFAANPQLALEEINQFVENITEGNIRDILPADALTPLTRLVLVNAAYFKGQWASKFQPEDTTKDVFFRTADQHTLVDMMKVKGTFFHAVNERLGCHVLEMPYKGQDDGISMVVFLPPLQNTLDDVISRLTPKTLQDALEDGIEREVEVKFPKFSFEETYHLVPILNQMGITDLFTPSANITGLSDMNLNLDDAVHKAKIEVDEEGATAAAATVLFSFRSSRPLQPAQFYCNHPFLFLIYDHKSKAILFAGVYRGTEETNKV